MTADRVSRQQLLALVGLTLMWGINWPVMKLAVSALPPLYLRGITMGLASLWLLVYFKHKGIRIWPATSTEWRDICLLGLPNIFLWHSLSILGIVSLPSGRASILGFMFPVWTVVIGVLFMGEALTRRVQTLTVWMMLLSSPFILLWSSGTEVWPDWQFTPAIWGTLFYAVFINYGFAQIIWFGMARDLPPATSAMSIMAVPMTGTLFATFMVGEWPHWQDFVAMVCVVTAIAAVLLPAKAAPVMQAE